MRLPHWIHRDSRWRTHGIYAYYECRCGARRTRRLAANLAGPVAPGWPEPRDKHGRILDDSGWIKPCSTS